MHGQVFILFNLRAFLIVSHNASRNANGSFAVLSSFNSYGVFFSPIDHCSGPAPASFFSPSSLVGVLILSRHSSRRLALLFPIIQQCDSMSYFFLPIKTSVFALINPETVFFTKRKKNQHIYDIKNIDCFLFVSRQRERSSDAFCAR